jgi:hypothetical protein
MAQRSPFKITSCVRTHNIWLNLKVPLREATAGLHLHGRRHGQRHRELLRLVFL